MSSVTEDHECCCEPTINIDRKTYRRWKQEFLKKSNAGQLRLNPSISNEELPHIIDAQLRGFVFAKLMDMLDEESGERMAKFLSETYIECFR